MNLDQIRTILDLVREHELAEFELEQDGVKIRVRKDVGLIRSAPPAVPANPQAGSNGAGPAADTAEPTRMEMTPERPAVVEPVDEGVELAVIKSPIVGTFYRSPEPAAPPFVETGTRVRRGQVLCIIEAMKLMNEIESECDGEIVSIYVENGQPVQYGERLFAINVA
jgi:acetyl-CoA carboxylase biotin carboxyl carrier protein